MRGHYRWAALLCLALLAAGCAGKSVQNQLLLELTVRAATSRVLHERPAWRPEVVRIAAGASLLLSGDETTTLGGLEEYVVAEVPWGQMLPEEQALARTSIGLIRATVEDHLRERGVEDPGERLVRVRQVLGWIEDTARLGGGA